MNATNNIPKSRAHTGYYIFLLIFSQIPYPNKNNLLQRLEEIYDNDYCLEIIEKIVTGDNLESLFRRTPIPLNTFFFIKIQIYNLIKNKK